MKVYAVILIAVLLSACARNSEDDLYKIVQYHYKEKGK
jgi:hypothetical protein